MGIVEKLKTEFDLEEEWVPYELHSDTPAEGVEIVEKFPDLSLEKLRAGLNSKGEQYGVSFGNFSRISNSSMALQIGELAKEKGCYGQFHEKIFEAYFRDALDIGNLDVVLDVATSSGLEREVTLEALNSGRFLDRLEQARVEVSELGITAAPTFIINGQTKMVGALPYVRFVKALTGN